MIRGQLATKYSSSLIDRTDHGARCARDQWILLSRRQKSVLGCRVTVQLHLVASSHNVE
jgi:hypothetical protein